MKVLGAGETLSLATHAKVRRGQVALTSSLSRGSCKRKTSINQLTFFLNRLWESVSVYMYVFNWWFLYHKYTSVYLKKGDAFWTVSTEILKLNVWFVCVYVWNLCVFVCLCILCVCACVYVYVCVGVWVRERNCVSEEVCLCVFVFWNIHCFFL